MASGAPPPCSPEDERREVTDSEIVDIAVETAADWLKIARRLPDVSQPGKKSKLAFKLNDSRLNDLKRSCPDDEEKVVQLLSKWRAISSRHTWGPPREALYKSGFGAVADQVLDVSRAEDGKSFQPCT